jgi:hypothetical protein
MFVMTESGTFGRNSFPELPLVDTKYLVEHSFEWFKSTLDETGDRPKARDVFFSSALMGFYDPTYMGLGTEAGHIVYRLSDHLSEAERSTIKIYPSPTGSLSINGNRWDSLEDWRKEWESLPDEIPHFDFGRGLKEALGLPELLQSADTENPNSPLV